MRGQAFSLMGTILTHGVQAVFGVSLTSAKMTFGIAAMGAEDVQDHLLLPSTSKIYFK